MRIFWLPFVIALLINVAVDYYIYRKLTTLRRAGNALSQLHIVLAAVAHITMIAALLQPVFSHDYTWQDMTTVMKVIWFYAMFYVPKVLWALLYQLSRPHSLPRWLRVSAKAVALVAAMVAFCAMWKGYFVTPYRCEVTTTVFESKRLPAGFDGYRICHISDMHLGTYDNDTTFIAQCIDTINALQPDVIMFTGDLVSRTTDEAYAFTPQLSRLKARDGVIAVLGNHDYDFYTTLTDEQKKEDHQELCNLIKEVGWRLLGNENMMLHRGGDSIAVVGTENYSRGHMPNHCDYKKALHGVYGNKTYTILLQHNPQLWYDEVLGFSFTDLTLSGHTHAMQCKLRFFGTTVSPAALFYNQWGGFYNALGQAIYVNTGLGMVGVPARIGATPEITLITLKTMAQ